MCKKNVSYTHVAKNTPTCVQLHMHKEIVLPNEDYRKK